MDKNTAQVTVTATTSNFLKKLPKKKIAITATAVVATLVAGYFVKNNLDVDVDTASIPSD